MTAPDNILDRLEKLLRLAESPNEHEAQAAMAKAQQLMDDYNIDASTIGQSAKGRQGAARKDEKSKGGLYGWQRDVWKAVAECNFCRYWSIRGTARGAVYEHRLLGSTVNVKSTQIMANYLQQAIERLAKEQAKRDHYNVFAREMIAFREGMADRICERLRALQQERMAEAERKKREAEARAAHPSAATGNALVVLTDVMQDENDLNNDYEMGWEPGTTARRRLEEQQAAAMRRAKQELWERDKAEFERTYGAEEAARMRAYDKRMEDYRAYCRGEDTETYGKGYKPSRSRPSRATGVGRTRKPTGREERAFTPEYRKGVDKGDSVSLNQQVDHDGRNKLEGN